ncbi:MAG TPA: type II toxin-antitoxin system VapC family toxin [Actinomycetes bacterium]
MNYLLDTNACIALINGSPRSVRRRLDQALDDGASAAVSTVAAFELWYGAAKSARAQANRQRLETFFAAPLELLPFDDGDARLAGEVRAALEAAGTPIGAYDLLIAGQARRHDATLVTANGSEFSRVAGLRMEDWAS